MRRDRGPQRDPERDRIGVAGDPTPDAEYGEPEGYQPAGRPESSSSKKELKCPECGNTKKVDQDDDRDHSCMRMTFDPDVGEVPCGEEMEEVDQS